jgi:adenine specific DNA methylase Mod
VLRSLCFYFVKKVNFLFKMVQYILHKSQWLLCEYLIKTYTNEEDIVLDNTAGSGTTGLAAKNLNRNYILIEKEFKWVEVIKKRIPDIDIIS